MNCRCAVLLAACGDVASLRPACRTNHFKRGHSTGASVESNSSGKAHRVQSAESTRSGSASNTASVGGGAGATPTPDKAGTCVFCFFCFRSPVS
jgi:hypothetical protein